MVEPESSRPSRAPPPVDRCARLLSDFAAADGPRTPRHNARLRQPRRGSGALSALPHQERLFGQRLPWWHLRGLRIVRFEIELIWCAQAQHEPLRWRVVGPGAVPRTYSAVPSCSKSPRPKSTGVVAPRDFRPRPQRKTSRSAFSINSMNVNTTPARGCDGRKLAFPRSVGVVSSRC